MIETRVHAIGVDQQRSQPLVLLEETAPPGRLLPIWMTSDDATEVERARQGMASPRPGTHALIGLLISQFERRLTGIRITELREAVFHAELVLDDGTTVDSRASDALTLALQLDARIEVADDVFDRAGVAKARIVDADDQPVEDSTPGGTGPAWGDDTKEIEDFRRFLDEASPSDFDPDR
ncbi:MAG: bifunctional nuclease family protein [Pseudonocardia sp.]|nr:bifunctional nuclease family protein [Pseudonocardia sp.]